MGAGKGHTVDLNNPDLAICVEIIKNVCCMSVVRDLFKLRKYNIHEVNEQIHHSQSRSRTEEGRIKDQSDKTRSLSDLDNQNMPKTEGNHTEVDQLNEDTVIVKESQEKSDLNLNETATKVNSDFKDARDTVRSKICESETTNEI